MFKQLRALYLLPLCIALPTQAGLFTDEDAHKQIQQLEARIVVLEESKKEQTKSLFNLQEQIDLLHTDTRKLRGANEELTHGLQDAEKRARDFYVDLDTRIRHLDVTVATAQATAEAVANSVATAEVEEIVVEEPYDPAKENRAFEAAYLLLGEGQYAEATTSFQEFIAQYPNSAHIPNTKVWLGNAQFGSNDYESALTTFKDALNSAPNDSRAADILFNIAGCQQGLDQIDDAIKTLEQLVSQHPKSKAAKKAKKLLTPVPKTGVIIRKATSLDTGITKQSDVSKDK
jgi:tol-pal system protein YbgF